MCLCRLHGALHLHDGKRIFGGLLGNARSRRRRLIRGRRHKGPRTRRDDGHRHYNELESPLGQASGHRPEVIEDDLKTPKKGSPNRSDTRTPPPYASRRSARYDEQILCQLHVGGGADENHLISGLDGRVAAGHDKLLAADHRCDHALGWHLDLPDLLS